MKKQIILMLAIAIAFGSTVFAQDAPVKKVIIKKEVKAPKAKKHTKKTVKKVVKKHTVKKKTTSDTF